MGSKQQHDPWEFIMVKVGDRVLSRDGTCENCGYYFPVFPGKLEARKKRGGGRQKLKHCP